MIIFHFQWVMCLLSKFREKTARDVSLEMTNGIYIQAVLDMLFKLINNRHMDFPSIKQPV